jgi:hypothetical protein
VDPVDRLRTAGKRMTDPLELRAQIVAEHAIDLVVHSLDMNYLVRQVDLNAVIAQVDLNELLAQVDVNAIVRRVDIDALVEQTDIGRYRAVIRRRRERRPRCAAQPGRRARRVHRPLGGTASPAPYTGAPGPPGPLRVRAPS